MRGRWTRSRPGCCSCCVGRGTRVQRFLMALPKRYETVARLGFTSTTGDTEGEIAPGTMPPRAFVAADGPDHAAPARLQRRSRSAASAPTRSRAPGEEVEIPEREVEVTRFELLWREDDARGVRDRVLLRHLRALADHGPARRLLRRAAAHADRRLRRRRRRRGAAHRPRRRARRSCRGRARAATTPRKAAHGVAVPGRATGICRLRDEDGLIALAEPRGGAPSSPS